REFLAAKPSDETASPDDLGCDLRKRLQHPIADPVSEAIVDRLETVEVDREQSGRRFRIPSDELFAFLEESTAVGDAGQRIDHRCDLVEMLDALFCHG